MSLDPPASGMYEETSDHDNEQQSQEVFARSHHISDKPSATIKVPTSYYEIFTESPVPFPPTTQASSHHAVLQHTPSPEPETSIVYETPLRYSQLQELPCYDDIFGQVQPDMLESDEAPANKRRKLTQACT